MACNKLQKMQRSTSVPINFFSFNDVFILSSCEGGVKGRPKDRQQDNLPTLVEDIQKISVNWPSHSFLPKQGLSAGQPDALKQKDKVCFVNSGDIGSTKSNSNIKNTKQYAFPRSADSCSGLCTPRFPLDLYISTFSSFLS